MINFFDLIFFDFEMINCSLIWHGPIVGITLRTMIQKAVTHRFQQ